MAYKRKLKVFFYQILLPPNVTADVFKSLIDAAALKDIKKLIYPIRETKHVIDFIPDTQHFNLLKERKGTWPYLLKDDGKIRKVRLTDATLSEMTCFKFDQKNMLLAEAYNHFGPSISSLKIYLVLLAAKEKIKLNGIDFAPVLNSDAFARYKKMRAVRKIKFKVSNPSKQLIDEIANSNLPLSLDLLSQTGGTDLAVEISTGHSRLSMLKSKVSPLINIFMRHKETKKLSVRGEEGVDGTKAQLETLNLLNARLKSEFSIETKDQYFDLNNIQKAIDDSLSEHSVYLKSLLRNDKN